MGHIWSRLDAIPAGQFFLAVLLIFAAMWAAGALMERRERKRPRIGSQTCGTGIVVGRPGRRRRDWYQR